MLSAFASLVSESYCLHSPEEEAKTQGGGEEVAQRVGIISGTKGLRPLGACLGGRPVLSMGCGQMSRVSVCALMRCGPNGVHYGVPKSLKCLM